MNSGCSGSVCLCVPFVFCSIFARHNAFHLLFLLDELAGCFKNIRKTRHSKGRGTYLGHTLDDSAILRDEADVSESRECPNKARAPVLGSPSGSRRHAPARHGPVPSRSLER